MPTLIAQDVGVRLTRRQRQVCLVVVLASAAICVTGAMAVPDAFWPAWLTAVVFWLGTPLGCLSIALLHRLTGGNWGNDSGIGREVHVVAATVPILGLAIVPLLFSRGTLYRWADTEIAATAFGEHQRAYLAAPFVLGRTLAEWLVWSGLSLWLVRDYRRDVSHRWHLGFAAAGLIVFFLSVTAAVIDGVMSLSPGWSSSLFGLLQIVGFATGGLALAVVLRSNVAALRGVELDRQATHDLGNLLLAFNMVWGYLAFSQYLIVWSGDLRREVTWYVERRSGMATAASAGLAVFHFFVPLLLLLSRDIKRDPRRLAGVAGLILFMRLVDHAWTIFPSVDAGFVSAAFLVVAWIALGAAWCWIANRIEPWIPVLAGTNAEEIRDGLGSPSCNASTPEEPAL